MLEKIKKILLQSQKNNDPKISIYLPTARTMPDSQRDAITFKNLIQEAQSILEDKYNRIVWEPIILKLEKVQKDPSFWSHSKDGLAIFADVNTFEFIRVLHPFEKKVVVQKYFYVAPLLDVSNVDDNYLIDLGKDRLTIYKIEDNKAEVLVQDQIKISFPELFDDFDSNSNVNFGSYGGKNQTTFHGHRARPEEQEKDREKYFRYVDQQLAKLVSKNEPHVILAGTSDTVSQFKHIAKGKFYFEQVIDKPFAAMGHRQQEQAIIKIIAAHLEILEEVEKNNYDFLKSRNKVILDPEKILRLIEQGQVGQIIISKKYVARAEENMNRIVTEALLSNVIIHVAKDNQFKDRLAGVLR